MKNSFTKILFILFSLFIFSSSQAQTFSYFLEIETDTYTDLEEATELTSIGDFWDDPEYNIPIGFSFDFYGETYTNTQIIGLGLGSWLAFQDPYTVDSINFLIPYFDDLADIETIDSLNQSTISYTTEGLVGERILKIQWKDCGFYEEIFGTGTANNTLSFQLWLFEGTNNIEVRFGPSMLPDSATVHDYGSPVVGIIEDYSANSDTFENFWHLSGSVATPTMLTSDASIFYSYSVPGLDADPPEG